MRKHLISFAQEINILYWRSRQRNTTLKITTAQTASLVMLRKIVEVEVYVPEVITSRLESVDSDKEGTSWDMHLMRHASKKTKNLDEQIILLLSRVSWVRMLRTTLNYLAQIGPPAITIEAFPRNGSDMTRFSKFHCKRVLPNGEAVGHPWLLFLAWKNIIFCYYCKLFSSGYPLAEHSIRVVSAGTTLVPPFWSKKYLAREEVLTRVAILWFIGFNGAVSEISAGEFLASPFRASPL